MTESTQQNDQTMTTYYGTRHKLGSCSPWVLDGDGERYRLLDTATAALGAREHNHGNDGSSIPALLEHIEHMRSRLVAALAGGTS